MRRFRIPRSAFRILAAGALISCGGQKPAGEPVVVTIPRGASFEAAVESLSARGLVRSSGLFRLYARLRGLPTGLKSGTYRLPKTAGWPRIVTTLKTGRGIEIRWTVPEALMLFEVADLAQAQLGVPRDSVIAAARDSEKLNDVGVRGRGQTLEGYLFPTTYVLPVGIGARDLVRVMVREFTDNWKPEWDARLDTLGMSRHQVVTLASIIEAEVRYDPDREYVSAVYHNRLRRGMPLQADPTVIYAHGRRLTRVWEKNLRIRSPYNTYLHPGLPPGPIGQAGAASLAAALYPKPVPYLYFVAQPDGKHIFSATYREHLAAIRTIKAMPRAAREPRTPGR
ncbi:MAG: endolytic transglycosylase MltG [Gemmatimonadetes bacterium]|nr:endolytic transglycosylase MltG [Gemmatimonadota bacterium]